MVFHIQNGDVLDVLKHPNASRYPKQNLIVLNIDGSVYLVPYVEGMPYQTLIASTLHKFVTGQLREAK
ncbi:MAG: hypothetical protein ACRERD_01830 [Candidatus Binatia bacterium]